VRALEFDHIVPRNLGGPMSQVIFKLCASAAMDCCVE
jgi:hypothetical protein